MKISFMLIAGLVIFNVLLLWFEKEGRISGWMLFLVSMALLAISSLSLFFGFAIIVSITALNLLTNTRRLQNIMLQRR